MFCSALTNICAIALLWLPLDCFGEEPYDRKEKGGFLALLDLCIYIQNRYGKQEISRASIPIVFLLLTQELYLTYAVYSMHSHTKTMA